MAAVSAPESQTHVHSMKPPSRAPGRDAPCNGQVVTEACHHPTTSIWRLSTHRTTPPDSCDA
eukprot:2428573-Prymnesium_polylepis.1